jgi:hypothetical protein
LPAFALHKIFEHHTGNAEMFADIGNFDGVGPDSLHCHDSALRNKSLGDHERVGMMSALQQLAPLDALPEMRYSENARDKCALFGRWNGKDFLVSSCPLPSGIFRAVINFIEGKQGGVWRPLVGGGVCQAERNEKKVSKVVSGRRLTS